MVINRILSFLVSSQVLIFWIKIYIAADKLLGVFNLFS